MRLRKKLPRAIVEICADLLLWTGKPDEPYAFPFPNVPIKAALCAKINTNSKNVSIWAQRHVLEATAPGTWKRKFPPYPHRTGAKRARRSQKGSGGGADC